MLKRRRIQLIDEPLANEYVFEMWPRKELKLSLKDVLAAVEGKGLDWTLHWVDAIGLPPSQWIDWEVHDFEKITQTPEGVKLSWEELCEWANGLEDLQDIELTGRMRPSGTLRNEEAGELIYFIEDHDSTVWTIRSKAVTDVSTLITPP